MNATRYEEVISDKRTIAMYRMVMKRALKTTGATYSNEDSCNALRSLLHASTLLFPVHVALSVDRWYKAAAKCWEDGNNSGNSEYLERMELECEIRRNAADAVVAQFGIQTDYPGLYPTFKVNGRTYYDLESALRYWVELNRA